MEVALAERLILADRLVRSRLRGDDDLAAATGDALARNRDTLEAGIGHLLPAASASDLSRLLTDDVAATGQYGGALARHDANGASASAGKLRADGDQIARLLAQATHEHLTTAVARSGLATYADAVVGQADAYSRGDFAGAYIAEQTGYDHMFTLGREVATAFAAARGLHGDITSPEQDLQSRFQSLLGEHATLMSDVLRSGLQGSPDFAAAAAALNANSATLAKAVDASLGGPASGTFAGLWATQVDGIVQYTRAAAAGDVDRKRTALASLQASAARLGTAVAQATSGHVRADQLTPVLNAHDSSLVQQAEDYAAQNGLGARTQFVRDYEQVVSLAAPLSAGIMATAAKHAPRGGAQTGEGGRAREVAGW